MSKHYVPRGLPVAPRSIVGIREEADTLRKRLRLDALPIDMHSLVEWHLHECGINWGIADVEQLGDMEAAASMAERALYLREDTYYALTESDTRARYTVAHELGHIVLEHSPVLGYSATRLSHEPFRDSEWQADTFAAEFLMPHTHIVGRRITATALAADCGVSLAAATTRLKVLRSQGLVPLT